MSGSNHVLAGAIIAAAIPQPAVALPLAFLSHFVLDALPHYGDKNGRSWLGRHFDLILITDGIISAIFLSTVIITQPENWLLMIACAVVAVIPDLLWLPYYLADKRGRIKHHTRLAEFLKWIQWAERPWGMIIEIIWLIASLIAFYSIAF